MQVKLSRPKISSLVKKLGYRYKQMRFDEAYLQLDQNVASRKNFSQKMVTLMEEGWKFVSTDETAFNGLIQTKKAW